ncbi:MAG: hypothetical protein HQL23_01760 [Candidatus Omnitrophica bacterium]|nr:hypothetical protein [Candidatus Omnitrophota bacterium]
MRLKNYLFFAGVLVWAVLSASRSFALDIDTSSPFADKGVFADKRISMDFKGAVLNDILKIFSQQSGLNFIAGEGVADVKLDLYLDKVPLQEALERVLAVNSLSYEMKEGSNIFVVNKMAKSDQILMTRFYPLKYATVSKSKLNSTLASAAGGGGGGKPGIVLVKGKISEDVRTNSLIVSDIPQQFPMIEDTIARLDVRVPLIMIEVEMIDVSKGTADKLGAAWGSDFFTFTGPSKTTIFPFNVNNKRGITTTPNYANGMMDFTSLTFTMQFIKPQTDSKSLARPRILTLNNETAKISIKTNEAIGEASTSSSTGTAGSTNVAAAERVDTGVFLDVTPQVNLETNEITLAVQPKVIEAKAGTVVSSANKQPFRDAEERGVQSILRVNDGDTVVIGGLLRSDNSKTVSKVPFLSSIPLLGAAFRHDDASDRQRELLIFLTPRVVKEDFSGDLSNRPDQKIIREQGETPVDARREKQIDQELTSFEKQGL